jgi:hypothetical protein
MNTEFHLKPFQSLWRGPQLGESDRTYKEDGKDPDEPHDLHSSLIIRLSRRAFRSLYLFAAAKAFNRLSPGFAGLPCGGDIVWVVALGWSERLHPLLVHP